MANSRARCSGCRDYHLRADLTQVGLVNVCSDACRRTVLDRHRSTVQRKVTKAVAKAPSRLHIRLRKSIRNRDKSCRFCGLDGRLEIHHIWYRSQGGPDVSWNLVLLCDEHHRLVHSSKKYWQPILRAYIWLHYVEGRRGLSIAGVERILDKRGLLPLILSQ